MSPGDTPDHQGTDADPGTRPREAEALKHRALSDRRVLEKLLRDTEAQRAQLQQQNHALSETLEHLRDQDPIEFIRRADTSSGLDVPGICSPPNP